MAVCTFCFMLQTSWLIAHTSVPFPAPLANPTFAHTRPGLEKSSRPAARLRLQLARQLVQAHPPGFIVPLLSFAVAQLLLYVTEHSAAAGEELSALGEGLMTALLKVMLEAVLADLQQFGSSSGGAENDYWAPEWIMANVLQPIIRVACRCRTPCIQTMYRTMGASSTKVKTYMAISPKTSNPPNP